MRIRDIHRAVAAATGESLADIERLGFQLESPTLAVDRLEEVDSPQLIDWDQVESDRFQQAYWGLTDDSLYAA